MIAFLSKNNGPGEIDEWLSGTSDALYLANVGIYVIQTLIGDSFMVRCSMEPATINLIAN